MSVWKQNKDLIDRLIKAQNSERNLNRDIMTFAGFMESREELEQYVLSHEG